VAVYGGVQVVNYNGLVNGAPKNPAAIAQIAAAQGGANFWRFGWPVAAGIGAALLGGAVLTW
jgi:hypothetical protein